MFTQKQIQGVKEILSYYVHQLYFVHLPQNIYQELQEENDTLFKKNLRFTSEDLLKQSITNHFEQTASQMHKFFQDCLQKSLPEASFKKMVVYSFIPQVKIQEYEQDRQFNALKLLLILLNQQLKEYLNCKSTIDQLTEGAKNPQSQKKYRDQQIKKIQKIIDKSQHLLEIQLTGQDISKYTEEEIDEDMFQKYKIESEQLKKQNEILQQKIQLLQKQNNILKEKVNKLELFNANANKQSVVMQSSRHIQQEPKQSQIKQKQEKPQKQTKQNTGYSLKKNPNPYISGEDNQIHNNFNHISQFQFPPEKSSNSKTKFVQEIIPKATKRVSQKQQQIVSDDDSENSESEQSEESKSQDESYDSTYHSKHTKSSKSSRKSDKCSFQLVCQASNLPSKKKQDSNSFKTHNEISTFFNDQ